MHKILFVNLINRLERYGGDKKTAGVARICFVPAGEMFPWEKLPQAERLREQQGKRGNVGYGLWASRYGESGSCEF